jgi:hypothetical protein
MGDKKKIDAIVWVYVAVACILGGLVLAIILWKTRSRNPYAISQMLDVGLAVGNVVGKAGSEVSDSDK